MKEQRTQSFLGFEIKIPVCLVKNGEWAIANFALYR